MALNKVLEVFWQNEIYTYFNRMFCSIFNASFHLKYISCWSEKQTEFGKIKIKANKLNFEKFKAKYGVPWIFFPKLCSSKSLVYPDCPI